MKIKAFLLVLALLASGSCNRLEKGTKSGSYLVIETITGIDLSGKSGSPILYSDVYTNSSVYNDNADIKAVTRQFDPLASTSTWYQNIMVDQVDVQFTLPDGSGMPGVSVPRPFSQQLSISVPVDTETQFSVIVITWQAKEDHPLIDLRTNPGPPPFTPPPLQLTAKFTLHGRDMAGNRVQSVSSSLTIICADFADPGTTTSSIPVPSPGQSH